MTTVQPGPFPPTQSASVAGPTMAESTYMWPGRAGPPVDFEQVK
jgi:hypothetical protein